MNSVILKLLFNPYCIGLMIIITCIGLIIKKMQEVKKMKEAKQKCK